MRNLPDENPGARLDARPAVEFAHFPWLLRTGNTHPASQVQGLGSDVLISPGYRQNPAINRRLRMLLKAEVCVLSV
jgi:hypothetical protein